MVSCQNGPRYVQFYIPEVSAQIIDASHLLIPIYQLFVISSVSNGYIAFMSHQLHTHISQVRATEKSQLQCNVQRIVPFIEIYFIVFQCYSHLKATEEK